MHSATATVPLRREPELLGQTVVVIGGSAGIGLETARRARAEGARLILIGRNPERLERAAGEVEALTIAAFDANDPVPLERFFGDLPARMAQAHLIIGRAGAGTVAELMVIGRPAILIPLPHALDDNQTPNADALAEAGGGWRVAQKDLTPQKLAAMLQSAFAAPDDLAKRAAAAHAQAKPDAAQRLADVVDRLARAA